MRYTKRYRLYKLLCLLLGTLLLSSCTPPPETPLRIGSVIWPGYEPLHLAKNLGYYDNSSIKLAELTAVSEVIHALRNGNLEGAALTLDEVLTLLDDNFELSLILIMDLSEGGDVLLSKPEIASLTELKGKRVAVEYTAVGAILLDGALDVAGLSAKDIDIISCPVNQHVDCYSSTDAVVTYEPSKTKLLKQGAKLLFDSSQIPGRILDVLVVKKATLHTHRHSLKQLIHGYFEALSFFHNQPDVAAKLMAPRMRISSSEVLASFDGLHLPSLQENKALLEPHADGSPPPISAITENLAQFMLGKGFLKNSLTISNFANSGFLPEQVAE